MFIRIVLSDVVAPVHDGNIAEQDGRLRRSACVGVTNADYVEVTTD
jgi:hypothetical protein